MGQNAHQIEMCKVYGTIHHHKAQHHAGVVKILSSAPIRLITLVAVAEIRNTVVENRPIRASRMNSICE